MNQTITAETLIEFTNRLDGMAVLDEKGCYTYVSRGWEEYTGWSAREALGRTVWEVIPETHATEVFKTGKVVTRGLVSKNGTPAFTTYYPRFDEKGRVNGVLLNIVIRGNESIEDLQRHIDALTNQVEFYRKELSRERGAKYSLDNIIGKSKAMMQLKEQIMLAAKSTSTVLIEGETGCGKELVAHAIHTLSRRSSGRFVQVNCAAIPAELMESEFFGYTEGAFTGASRKGKQGRFALADGGSIFLDEVNLLPTTMQPKFLRVLQEREIDPVGATKSKSIDIRVIAACNAELEQLVERGEFRRDLYYRLNVVRIIVPPLRERKDDIPLLVESAIERFNQQLGMLVEGVDKQAMQLLQDYDWPGNVRELHNAIESAMNQARGTVLKRQHFSSLVQRQGRGSAVQPRSSFNLAVEKAAFEKRLVKDALSATKGNRKAAAELLGISRTMLYQKLNLYQIEDVTKY